MGRPSKNASRLRKLRSVETAAQREKRMETEKKRVAKNRESETAENRADRLCKKRIQTKHRLANEERYVNHRNAIENYLTEETLKQRAQRLHLIRLRLARESEGQRAQRLDLIRRRLAMESEGQRAQRLDLIRRRLARESEGQRAQRLDLIRRRLARESEGQRAQRLDLIRRRLARESEGQRVHRLQLQRSRISRADMRLQSTERRRRETKELRAKRLNIVKEAARIRRNIYNAEGFGVVINVFADVPCAICQNALYPQQRCRMETNKFEGILPANLHNLDTITSCSRCATTIKKRKVPAQAYWNRMTVAAVPQELRELTDTEKRFLCRVIPFLKIVKISKNRFSQDWCKGQAVLFAQDVVELAEQLPLRPNQAGLILVSESLENVQRSRHFVVNMAKLQRALTWLLANNVLYKDVQPHFGQTIDVSDMVQIAEPATNNYAAADNAYTQLNDSTAVLHGSFHQGDERFNGSSRGRQCTAIAAVACVAFFHLNPEKWCRSDVDHILLVGDRYYSTCVAARTALDPAEVNAEYLAAPELLPDVSFATCKATISGQHQPVYNGHITKDNSAEGFPNLLNALDSFFNRFECGLMTANSTTVAVYRTTQDGTTMYWLFDSHARGPRGAKAPSRGTACCMRFDSVDRLHAMLRRNLLLKETSNDNVALNVFSLTRLEVKLEATQEQTAAPDDELQQQSQEHDTGTPSDTQQEQLENIETSMLRHIDEAVPELTSVVSEGLTLAEVKRKTAPPLNLERERRMEELAWYYMFPDGRNGFGEPRDVPITPLDYFQSRIMSLDKRFHRNDYLFYALSVVEYYRAKSSVSVSCRMRTGEGQHTPHGLVDNIHLTMRNVRGSASYWRQCCSELVAMVRSLGAPTWFLTFSCNDLNWPDMIKALLIADQRDPAAAEGLQFEERQALVRRYPVIVARQFTVRVNCLMRLIRSNQVFLGGPVLDFWYRIEFQNRGSPHLHMLLWCADVPDFTTPEGVGVIEQVVSCSLTSGCPALDHLVKKVQVHRHTSTCYKDRSDNYCRFGFPKPPNETTLCLGPDEALANNGRFCVLRRTTSETMVCNYNPDLLSLWEGNIDIQPCGNVTAVAYYVAKYASKCEPVDTGEVVREAVTRAKAKGGSVWKQLFSVSMSIMNQRLVSAAECAYRLCHLPLKMSSRKAVFVNSCKPQERFRLLRFEGGDTSILNNIFDRYVQRPDDLEQISLAEFAVRYETISGGQWTEEDGDAELVEEEHEPARFIRLRDRTRMRVRSKPAVLRTRYYTVNSDKEGYFYSLLVCHVPFRVEGQLLLDGETAEACFLRRQGELRPLLGNMSAEQFAHAEQVIQQALAQAVALDAARNGLPADNPGDATRICPNEETLNDQDDFCEEPGDRPAMPEDMFLANIRGLNVQQKHLFQRVSAAVVHDLNGQDTQLLLFVTGGAGSGKSFVLKLLVEHIKRCYAPTTDILLQQKFVEVASLTGVAARQIFGKTLHSLLCLPIEKGKTTTYKRMTGQRLERERQKWRSINWLVIDEISMVSYENLRMIHLRLQELKNNEKLFGGVSVLLFGDIMQLPPVKGSWCFVQPPWFAAEVNLWQQFSFCELTINMRQRNDNEFIELLNNLRVGELTTGQLELLCERRRVPLTADFADGAAVRIYPTIKQVDEYNALMTAENKKTHRVYTVSAEDESREIATYGKRPPESVIPKDINNCGGLPSTIQLAAESRVMLRRNILISDGLVNGAMGIVKSFKWPALRRDQLEEGELPESVLIQFDDDSIGTRVKDTNGCVAIPPVCATYQGTKGYGNIERRMLPLILSWAVTVHKLQGTTLDRAVIDLGKKNFAKGQAYVALSRVKSLEGIVLSDLEAKKVLIRPHDEKALAEMTRLRNLKVPQ